MGNFYSFDNKNYIKYFNYTDKYILILRHPKYIILSTYVMFVLKGKTHLNFNEFIKFSHTILQQNDIEYLLFGHLGDCHLHFHLIPNSENERDAIDCYHRIIQLSSKLGGVYSAEHGTGKRKKQDFIECYGTVAVDQVKKCKEAFDPHFLLNSGNVVDK